MHFLQSITCVPDLFPNDGHAQVEEDDAVASGAQHFHKVPKIATCQSYALKDNSKLELQIL